MTPADRQTHSTAVGYILWIFGFTGAHRFYFGKRETVPPRMLTAWRFRIRRPLDVILMPELHREATRRSASASTAYS